jgi:hypothetical protein
MSLGDVLLGIGVCNRTMSEDLQSQQLRLKGLAWSALPVMLHYLDCGWDEYVAR